VAYKRATKGKISQSTSRHQNLAATDVLLAAYEWKARNADSILDGKSLRKR
jgi:hypothetical protein